MNDATRIHARPTVYEGVRMRSRLEAGFAQWADSFGLGVDYEPQAFASAGGQYLPDFRLRYVWVEGALWRGDPHDSVLWVEVKPELPTGAALVRLHERMEIIHHSEPDAALAICYKDPTPGLLVKINDSTSWWPSVWTIGEHPYHIGVARPLDVAGLLPWPDGYWKGPLG